MSTPDSGTDELVLGEIVGVFGIRGELRIFLHHRESDTLREEREVWLVSPTGERRKAQMVVRPGAGKRILAKVRGIDTPEAAETLVGRAIHIARPALPPTEEGEYYIHDLIGMAVEDETGRSLGMLEDVVPGARDVWVIDTGDEPLFVVAEPEAIHKVDLANRRIVVAAAAVG